MLAAGGRFSDSRRPLHRLPSPRASGVSAEGVSSHSGGTVPDLHRVPSPLAFAGGAYHRGVTASRAFWVWAPVLLWAGLIFGLSSVPDLGTGLGDWDLVLRKLAHVGEYAVLGLLLARALGREVAAFAAGVAYAVTDELHQHFVPGRQAAARDVAVDAAGVLVGTLVARKVLR